MTPPAEELWLVKGTEKSQGKLRVWPYYVLADTAAQAEQYLREYETFAFESVVVQYVGEFDPQQVATEWGDIGADIVRDLLDDGVADLFWWEPTPKFWELGSAEEVAG